MLVVALLGAAWCQPKPEPTPPPITTPPTTTLPGPADPCPFDVPRIGLINCRPFSPWGEGLRWDCTAKQGTKRPGGEPVWPEGDGYRAACERKSADGDPGLLVSDKTGTLAFRQLLNPYQFVLTGSGTAVLHCVVPSQPGVELCGYVVSK